MIFRLHQVYCRHQSFHILLLQKFCLHKKYSMKDICTLRIYICVYKPSILPLKNIQPLATEAETFVHTNIPWVTYLMKYYSVRRCEQSQVFHFCFHIKLNMCVAKNLRFKFKNKLADLSLLFFFMNVRFYFNPRILIHIWF